MPRTTPLVTLLAALCLAASLATLAPPTIEAKPTKEYEEVAFYYNKIAFSYSTSSDGSCIPESLRRALSGPVVLRLERGPGGLRGSLAQRGRPPLGRLDLTVEGCQHADLEALRGGEAEIACSRRGPELRATKRGLRNCALLGEITWDTSGSPLGPRPDPGGPDQGALAAQALPNLKIRTAEAAAGDPTKLSTRVVNVGPGPSGATRLKLFFHTPQGQVLTAHEQVPALSAGQQAVVTIGIGQPLAAAKAVYLRVDDPNVVPETSEVDNGFTFKK